MHIAFAFNLKDDSACVEDAAEPPSDPPSEPPGTLPDDRYAEWDDIHTVKAVERALASRHQVSLVDANPAVFETFRRLRGDIDLVFNIAEGLHGASREGQLPAMLDMLEIPYTGSDPLTLGLCLDKRRTKEILSYNRVPTPRFWTAAAVDDIPRRLHFPLMVKPTLEGSSKGVTDRSLVKNRRELLRQVEWVLTSYRQPALIEEFLPGREFTVAMLGNGSELRALPIVEINFATLPEGVNPIYSYEAKWVWDREEDPLQIFTCPANIDAPLRQEIENVCKRAFHALGCRDWCRIDVRLDAKGHPQVIELNPLPGILPRPEQNSCFPKAARAAGLSYDEMILAVVAAAARRLGLDGGLT
ncbi:MAG: ATP-grasp domain-containing protein [Desulfuromonadales bacterium]|nr:ATP-grasp domain-containing protein [Desulfuromonadales bacterium]